VSRNNTLLRILYEICAHRLRKHGLHLRVVGLLPISLPGGSENIVQACVCSASVGSTPYRFAGGGGVGCDRTADDPHCNARATNSKARRFMDDI
jgi:hypothetical protein